MVWLPGATAIGKVRCAGCERYVDKSGTLPYGLGWCCDEGCRVLARDRAGAPGKRAAPTTPKTPRAPRPSPKALSSAKKKLVRQRDGNRCRICASPVNLQVHHIRYRSEGGSHKSRNLITLCLNDHGIVHSRKRYWQPILLVMAGAHYDHPGGRFLSVAEALRMLTEASDGAAPV